MGSHFSERMGKSILNIFSLLFPIPAHKQPHRGIAWALQEPKTLRQGTFLSKRRRSRRPQRALLSLTVLPLLALDTGTVMGSAHQNMVSKALAFQMEDQKREPQETGKYHRDCRKGGAQGSNPVKLLINSRAHSQAAQVWI